MWIKVSILRTCSFWLSPLSRLSHCRQALRCSKAFVVLWAQVCLKIHLCHYRPIGIYALALLRILVGNSLFKMREIARRTSLESHRGIRGYNTLYCASTNSSSNSVCDFLSRAEHSNRNSICWLDYYFAMVLCIHHIFEEHFLILVPTPRSCWWMSSFLNPSLCQWAP